MQSKQGPTDVVARLRVRAGQPKVKLAGGGPALSNETKSCKKQNHMPCFESDACMHARTSRQLGHAPATHT